MADQPQNQTQNQTQEDSLGYEEAREELVTVVRTLEQGGVTLEESLALWERGERLAQRCQEWLEGARSRLDEVVARRNDRPDDGEQGGEQGRSGRAGR